MRATDTPQSGDLEEAVFGALDTVHGIDCTEFHTHSAFVELDRLFHVLAYQCDVMEP